MSTGVCHRVQVTCSTFCEELGESHWRGDLPYMTAHIFLCMISGPVLSHQSLLVTALWLRALPLFLSLPLPLSLLLFLTLSVALCCSSRAQGSPSKCLQCPALHFWHWRYVCVSTHVMYSRMVVFKAMWGEKKTVTYSFAPSVWNHIVSCQDDTIEIVKVDL